MAKTKHQFEDFLICVSDEYKDFVTTVHEFLQNNFKPGIRTTKNGLSISYSHPGGINRILGFSFSKDGLMVQINAENHGKYTDVLNRMPKNIEAQVAKADDCRKLIGKKCGWDTCPPGYDFFIGKNHYQKCRYSCFKLNVDRESIPFLLKLLKSESKERLAV